MSSKISDPLISIFIPVYNAERFIAEAIESCLNQTYQNIELVISDDASTDKSWDLINDYYYKFPQKIKAYRQEQNLGVTKNCNFILGKCEGEYICHFAGDDLLGPDCIKRSLSFFNANFDLAIIFHKFQRIDENSQIIHQETSLMPHFGDIRDFLKKGIYLMCNGILVRKAAWPDLIFSDDLEYGSDVDYIYNILAHKDSKFYYTGEVHSYWRFHEQSLTNTKVVQTTIDAFISTYYLSLKYQDYAFYIKNTLLAYIVVFIEHNIIYKYQAVWYNYIFSKTDSKDVIYPLFVYFKESFIRRLKRVLEQKKIS